MIFRISAGCITQTMLQVVVRLIDKMLPVVSWPTASVTSYCLSQVALVTSHTSDSIYQSAEMVGLEPTMALSPLHV